jgi:hypothetical protein
MVPRGFRRKTAANFSYASVAPLAIMLVALNYDLYSFFFRQNGVPFIVGAIGLHWLYYLYSSAAFAYVILKLGIRAVRDLVPLDRKGLLKG